MKKILSISFIAAVLFASLTARAEAFKISCDSGPEGFTFTYKHFPLAGSGSITLTGPDDMPGIIKFRFILITLATLELSLESIEPAAVTPQCSIHYRIAGAFSDTPVKEGAISLPFGHAGISNSLLYRAEDIAYDMEGVLQIRRRRSNYVLNFGLGNLTGIREAQADPDNNTINQTILRDTGAHFATINLAFHPRPLTCTMDFSVTTITPREPENPDDAFTFSGSLPMPYGNYHLWFYRDPKY